MQALISVCKALQNPQVKGAKYIIIKNLLIYSPFFPEANLLLFTPIFPGVKLTQYRMLVEY